MLSACHSLPASLAVCTRQAAAVLKERRTVRVKKSYHYIIKNNRKVTSSSRRKPEQQFRFQSSLHSVNFKASRQGDRQGNGDVHASGLLTSKQSAQHQKESQPCLLH